MAEDKKPTAKDMKLIAPDLTPVEEGADHAEVGSDDPDPKGLLDLEVMAAEDESVREADRADS